MGVPELLRTVVREDGFRALYRGVTPSLMGIIPYAGIAFSINEQAKHEASGDGDFVDTGNYSKIHTFPATCFFFCLRSAVKVVAVLTLPVPWNRAYAHKRPVEVCGPLLDYRMLRPRSCRDPRWPVCRGFCCRCGAGWFYSSCVRLLT